MASTASPLDPIAPYLHTLVFFAAYTILYKHNPLYRFTQSLVVGVGAGYIIVSNLMNFNRLVLTQVYKAGALDPYMLIPIVLGLGFLCLFIPRLIGIYRAVAIITMCVGLGVVLPYGPATFWTATTGLARNALNMFGPAGITTVTVGALVAAISYGLATSYFFFTGVMDKPTRPFRRAGRVVLLIYTAMCISLSALGKINLVQWKVLDTIQGVPATWWIPVGLFLLCIIDAWVFPLGRLMGRAQVVEAKT